MYDIYIYIYIYINITCTHTHTHTHIGIYRASFHTSARASFVNTVRLGNLIVSPNMRGCAVWFATRLIHMYIYTYMSRVPLTARGAL